MNIGRNAAKKRRVEASAPAAPPATPSTEASGAPAASSSGLLLDASATSAPPASPSVAGADTGAAPTSPAHSDPDAAERAKALYQKGAEAFTAQRNAEAISYFRRAAELAPNPKLTYNIALAYEEMGDTGRALAEYRSYLRHASELERQSDALARVRALEAALAASGVQQLSVASEPAGATVRIDGRTMGVTPWTGELAPGEHEVALALAGHASRNVRVTLDPAHASEVSLTLPSEPAPAERDAELDRRPRVAPLTWSFLGVGVGALAGGLAFELSRASSSERAENATSPVDAARASGEAHAKQMTSLVLLGIGGAFSVAGGILLARDLDTGDEGVKASLTLPCTPGFCGVNAVGRF